MDNLSKDDKRRIEAINTFLQAETFIKNDEGKLGEILKGMYETVHQITENTSTIYGHGVGVSKKIAALKSKLSGKELPTFDLNLEKLLKIHAQANEILKLLVNDHQVITTLENKELQYSQTMKRSFEKYMTLVKTYTEIHAGIKLNDKAYQQNADSIISAINDGKTYEQKRNSILQRLSQTFMDILNVYKEMLKKNQDIVGFYKRLSVEYPSKSSNSAAESAIKEIDTGDIIDGIISEMTGREESIRFQLVDITAQLKKIGVVIVLSEDIKKHIQEMEQQKTNL